MRIVSVVCPCIFATIRDPRRRRGHGSEGVAGVASRARHPHRVLVASSAIPGLFPPVVIDGHVHTDGGVVANVLSVLDLADYRRLADRLRALG
jgi:Patatin-like phospholipase